MAKRRKFTDQFKAKVALEALRSRQTPQQCRAALKPIFRPFLSRVFRNESLAGRRAEAMKA
ncbi:hypothetical protein, partial [Ruegeria sp. HKCCSP335]|uniref:hypothetical protein n=1 Tax=Ruegeria sp. HKCCSP335 TaxID=2794833 RepID=UPI001AE61AE2